MPAFGGDTIAPKRSYKVLLRGHPSGIAVGPGSLCNKFSRLPLAISTIGPLRDVPGLPHFSLTLSSLLSYIFSRAATNLLDADSIVTGEITTSEILVLLEEHHLSGYGWALSCCRYDRAEAEEVLQTVYLKVLEGKARFRGDAGLRTWFFAVIRKTALDERRRSFLRKLGLISFVEKSAMLDRAEHPDDSVYRAETSELFRSALSELPRRQREALQLVFYHDLTLDETAAVMGVSIGSARTHYERGKRRLREFLKESKFNEQQWQGRQASRIL